MLVRAFLVGLIILVLEVLHGIARALWLVPLVGDLPARQIGVATGSLLILLVAALTVRWIRAQTPKELLSIGALWVVLMLAAELALGRYVFGYAWSRIAEDFDPARGGLLAVGMVVLGLAPWLVGRSDLRNQT